MRYDEPELTRLRVDTAAARLEFALVKALWIESKSEAATDRDRSAFEARLRSEIRANDEMLLTHLVTLGLRQGSIPRVDVALQETLAEWDRNVAAMRREPSVKSTDPGTSLQRLEALLVRRFAGRINTERQTGLGIEQYIWRSRDDGLVRDLHAGHDDKVFSWSRPPEGGHPGEAFNCRCVAEPVVDAGSVGSEEAPNGTGGAALRIPSSAQGDAFRFSRNDPGDADGFLVAGRGTFGQRNLRPVRIHGRQFVMTPRQATEYAIARMQADQAIARAREINPRWRPRPGAFESPMGAIANQRAIVREADQFIRDAQTARFGGQLTPGIGHNQGPALPAPSRPARRATLGELIAPGGRLVGTRAPGARSGIQTVEADEMSAIIDSIITYGERLGYQGGYGGVWYRTIDGAIVGIRTSADHGITLEVRDPGPTPSSRKMKLHIRENQP
ncbi:phage minor head protein [Acuticoccus yangtzensis]|uniref:phage minor head protein n=1 Tax=Acuticoccus yangtzensis TaxID=1443441 RepID=UPI000B0B5627|nr:phage minor head protein [Acuticoccus yangtzensis]